MECSIYVWIWIFTGVATYISVGSLITFSITKIALQNNKRISKREKAMLVTMPFLYPFWLSVAAIVGVIKEKLF